VPKRCAAAARSTATPFDPGLAMSMRVFAVPNTL
jgi:hypothetical protein